MKRLLLILFLLTQFELFGMSDADSLRNLIHTSLEQDKRAEALLKLSSLLNSEDTSQTIEFANQAIAIGQSLQKPAIVASAEVQKAECMFAAAEYTRAIGYYRNAVQAYQEMDSIQPLGELYNSIGLSYYYLGEYDKALENQIEAVKNFELTSNEDDLARIYINMGMVYNRLGDYDLSVQYYRKASQISRIINNPERLANSYNGMGVAYYNIGQLDSAKVFYRKALYGFSKTDKKEKIAASINNLANIYVEENDSIELGLNYYLKAYRIFDEIGNLRNKVFVMEGLGCAYRETGDYEKSLSVLHEGLNMAIENQYGYYIIQLYYKDLASVYEKKGAIGLAYASFKNYKLYVDSMRQEERLWQAAAIEKKYEFKKSEAIISELNAEKDIARIQMEKDKAFRNLGIFAILVLLGIITYVSFGNYTRKRINRILIEKNIQIEAQRNELEQMNASKNKFFSIIAHDLKNPLHTVLGYSFLMHHDYDRFQDKDRKKYAQDIYNSTNSIFRLLQNLLDWSKSQTGRLKYEPVVFELSTLQEKICTLLTPVANQKEIVLSYEVPGDIYVYATPMMIETILRNLVNNAIKFTRNGGQVQVGFKRDKREVSVYVKDTGIGMSADELNQLFSIDSKIKRKGTNNEDGSGLGLILCKEFIQLNQGLIWAESQAGEGSTFFFTIPLALENN